MHRLILDRAPFFSTAFSEPWTESNAKELTLYPQDVDSNITQESFEKTLHCIYGKTITANTQEKAAGILATACWLELKGLIACSTTWMLRFLNPATISWPIRLVTENYYGSPGQVILTAAKAVLCRDGWEMPMEYWDNVPGDIVREVVSSDGFFVDGEWSRWLFARRLFNRRLKMQAITCNLINPHSSGKMRVPDLSRFKSFKFDSWLRKDVSSLSEASQQSREWLSLYSHPDIEPLLYLLEDGIHYIHLSYEQLQYIRASRDFLDLPLVSEKAVTNALWSAMELRQTIQNAKAHEVELGLSVAGKLHTNKTDGSPTAAANSSQQKAAVTGKGKGKASELQYGERSDAWDLSLQDSDNNSNKSQKFWIPSVDSNSFVGRDDISLMAPQLLSSQACANGNDAEMQWTSSSTAHNTSNFSQKDSINPAVTTSVNLGTKAQPVAYSQYPPFRFAVEFANPKLLQENKRAYSRTVFYAGSFWRIYIQRKRSTKGFQLGVYLHRAKESETEDGGLNRGSAKEIGDGLRTVTETIGMMERGLFRTDQRRPSTFDSSQPYSLGQPDISTDDDAQLLLATANLLGSTPNQRSAYNRSMSSRYGIPSSPSPEVDRLADFMIGAEDNEYDHSYVDDDYRVGGPDDYIIDENPGRARRGSRYINFDNDDDNEDNHSDDLDTHAIRLYDSSSPLASRQQRLPNEAPTQNHSTIRGCMRGRRLNKQLLQNAPAPNRQLRKSQTPTLPPYVDTRPTIRTYFKIYNPSKGGRALSVYQSAPDNFNFSQSWGWKSNSMLEDENEGEDGDGDEGDEEQAREDGRERGGDEQQQGERMEGVEGTRNARTSAASAASAAAAALEAEATSAFGVRHHHDMSADSAAAAGVGAGVVSSSSYRAERSSDGITNQALSSSHAADTNTNTNVPSVSASASASASASTSNNPGPGPGSGPGPNPNMIKTRWKRQKGVLRFMVVIGNV